MPNVWRKRTPKRYPGADVAVDDARKQLLEALFEGTVRAEGVRCYPADPPSYEPPSIKYDEWHVIDPGVWSQGQCGSKNGIYRLDKICIGWDNDLIDYFNNDGEWAECHDEKIRLHRTDIDSEFPTPEKSVVTRENAAGIEKPVYRTGLAGRPSSKQLARQQMHRRASEGKLCDKLVEEVRELCEWLQKSHPDAPPATAKTLANALREDHRRLKHSVNP